MFYCCWGTMLVRIYCFLLMQGMGHSWEGLGNNEGCLRSKPNGVYASQQPYSILLYSNSRIIALALLSFILTLAPYPKIFSFRKRILSSRIVSPRTNSLSQFYLNIVSHLSFSRFYPGFYLLFFLYNFLNNF